MTETSQVWDGILTGDASLAPYSASEWADRTKLLKGLGATHPNYGVIAGTGDGNYPPLSVQAKSPVSANVEVKIGSALVDGYLYNNDAALTLAVGANASGNPRIDTVILRVDYVAQTVRAVVKQGTPAGSPVPPTLQQDATYWEIPLANIAVANGFASLAQTTITNRQRSVLSTAAGWQSVAYPINHVIGADYGASNHNFASGTAAVAVPFTLSGNMLLQDVVYRNDNSVGAKISDWGIYTQHTNDGQTSEHLLSLVAIGGGTTVTAGIENVVSPALPAPQILIPGAYWLIFRLTSSGSI